MNHHRYGDLDKVWAKTHGRCHLCHLEVDLATYGLADIFGADAATVDHLVPQSHGGDDHHDNLLPAHLGCNASRGTQPVAVTRFRMAGALDAPMSTDGRIGAGVAIMGLGALLGGALTAERDETGRKQFNTTGACVGGGIGLLLAVAALS
ncbi:MAG: HNH endonuclease [Deltaproteobacteria bacterium]|nr:HNH endonuclease [Deltaproteobacteria bacterium]